MKSLLFASLFVCLKISRVIAAGEVAVDEETTTDSAAATLVDEALSNVEKKDEKKAVKSVLMVCSENQSRSPIASAIFTELALMRGVGDQWRCDSAGIYVYHPEARWPIHKRARACLRNHHIRNFTHYARMVEEKDFYDFDYMLGMDMANVEDLIEKAPAGSRAKIELLSSYDPQGSELIENPFYDRDQKGYEACFRIAKRSCQVFLDRHA